ncbi:MAG: hypothetical protein ACI959_000894, partial [Limisphaerales bacterium]
RERKKRELNPMTEFLENIKEIGAEGETPEAAELHKTVNGTLKFANSVDKVLETVMRADETWFFKIFMKIIR